MSSDVCDICKGVFLKKWIVLASFMENTKTCKDTAQSYSLLGKTRKIPVVKLSVYDKQTWWEPLRHVFATVSFFVKTEWSRSAVV